MKLFSGAASVRRWGLATGATLAASGVTLEAIITQEPAFVTVPALLTLALACVRASPSPTFGAPELRLDEDVEARPSVLGGLGLFAVRPLRRGTFLMDYLGESLTEAEFTERYAEGGVADYGLELDGIAPWDAPVFVDARDPAKSNPARYMNHASDDNCNVRKVKQRLPFRALRLYAARDIQAGDELLWDYGPDYWRGREDKRRTKQEGAGEVLWKK